MTQLTPNEPVPPKQGVAKNPRNARNPIHLEAEKEFVLEQRKRGKSVRQIEAMSEEVLGYRLAKSTVQDRYDAAIADIKVPLVEEVRAQEIERMDHYLDKLSAKIDEGDEKAIATALRISERRSKLLGADAPVNVQAVVANVDVTDTPFGQVLQNQFRMNQEIAEELIVEEEDDA